jgi:hypothetical protein
MANPKPAANKGKGKCNWNWQIKLPKWQIAKMANCQNGKLPIETKNEDQVKHYLFANSIEQMTNPNYIANMGKGKCPSWQQKQTGSNGRSKQTCM